MGSGDCLLVRGEGVSDRVALAKFLWCQVVYHAPHSFLGRYLRELRTLTDANRIFRRATHERIAHAARLTKRYSTGRKNYKNFGDEFLSPRERMTR